MMYTHFGMSCRSNIYTCIAIFISKINFVSQVPLSAALPASCKVMPSDAFHGDILHLCICAKLRGWLAHAYLVSCWKAPRSTMTDRVVHGGSKRRRPDQAVWEDHPASGNRCQRWRYRQAKDVNNEMKRQWVSTSSMLITSCPWDQLLLKRQSGIMN